MTSSELGQRTGFSSEQVRKDLAYFGAFGTRGVGYEPAELEGQIRRILGLDLGVSAALVGAGHLGTALARYASLAHKDVTIVAIFDTDPTKAGQEIGGVSVRPLDELEAQVTHLGVGVGIIAVPHQAAQTVANRLVSAGVRGLLNFAPVSLTVPGTVYVQNIDLTLELQALAYFVRAHQTVDF